MAHDAPSAVRPEPLILAMLLALSGAAAVPAAQAAQVGVTRFAGLERLYFERLDPAARPSPAGELLVQLPARLPTSEPHVVDPAIAIRQFALPGAAQGLILRQAVDSSGRLAEQAWGLYDLEEGRRRLEVWHFTPALALRDGKLLAPYEVTAVEERPGGFLVLRTCGSVFRPGGSWWWQGKDLLFRIETGAKGREGQERTLTYAGAVGRFYVSHGPDAEGAISLTVERPTDAGRIEVRRLERASDVVLARCGWRDPEIDRVTCENLERFAACAAADRAVTLRVRPFGERTMIERNVPVSVP